MSQFRKYIAKRRLSELSIKLNVNYKGKVFKIRVSRETTVGGLLLKLREQFNVKPTEAIQVSINGKWFCPNVFLLDVISVTPVEIEVTPIQGFISTGKKI